MTTKIKHIYIQNGNNEKWKSFDPVSSCFQNIHSSRNSDRRIKLDLQDRKCSQLIITSKAVFKENLKLRKINTSWTKYKNRKNIDPA